MTERTPVKSWLMAFAFTAIAVVVCFAYVDRPVAEFLDQHVRRTIWWVLLERALGPFNLVVVAALLFLFACGIRVLSGGALGSWTRTPLLCSWATMWAIAAEIIFKRLFGRGWPDPTYVRDSLYGFHWLHGGPHWESFPSGTAATSAAFATVLWFVAPRWRTAAPLIAALLCVAVVLTNDHWVGDVIAGAFLGVSIGRMTVALKAPSRETFSGSA